MKNRFKVASNFRYFLILIFLALVLRFFWFFEQPGTVLPKNQQITFVGTLKEAPKIGEKWQILSLADVKVYLDKYPKYEAGDRVKVSGEADSQGRVFQAKVQKIGHEQTFGAYFSSLRTEISNRIMGLLPSREAALVVGSVLGIDSVDPAFKEVLTKTGTIHVVVVSGQNLAIVAGIFVSMAGVVGRRRAMVMAILATFLYSALAGFSPPVLRAAIMVLASSLAVFFGRELAVMSGLLLSAYLILFAWPGALFDLSFQLTFAASFGIMTLGKRMEYVFTGPARSFPARNATHSVAGGLPASARFDKVGGSAKGSFLNEIQDDSLSTNDRLRAVGIPSASVTRNLWSLVATNASVATSAYLFTAPLILYNFGSVSVFAPLANILAIEAVFPVILLGFCVAIFSVIYLPIAQVLAWFAYVPALYFVKVVEFTAAVSFGQVYIGQNNLIFVAGFYTLLLLITFGWRGDGK